MKFKLSVLLVLFVFALGTFFAPGTALAWEKGNIKIVPGFKTEGRWDSNVFYDSSDEKGDFITILTPSVQSEFGFGPGAKHKVRANYMVDLGIFGKYHDQNYGNHDMFGEVQLNFNKWNFTVNDNFLITSDRAGTEFEHRNLRKENTLNTILGTEFNKIGVDVGYQYYLVDYHSDLLKSLDRYENAVWMTGYVDIPQTTKARGLVEFEYRNIVYKHAGGRDGDAYSPLAGIKGQITPKLSGLAKAGYKYKAYRNSGRSDYSGAVAQVDLLYAYNDRTNLTFSYHREPFESTDPDNNYYTGDQFLANLSYNFGKNFYAIGDAQFYHNAYPNVTSGENKKRTDIEWALGGRLEYHWKEYLVAGAGYRFHQRESNIDNRDYSQHVIMGDVKLIF